MAHTESRIYLERVKHSRDTSGLSRPMFPQCLG
jgi:hypothetical protein